MVLLNIYHTTITGWGGPPRAFELMAITLSLSPVLVLLTRAGRLKPPCAGSTA